MNLLFWHRKNKTNGRNEAAIYCRITIEGERTDFTTNVFCPIGKFDAKRQIVLNNDISNMMLLNIKQKINSIFIDLSNKDARITPTIIKEYFTGKLTNKISISELIEKYNQYRLKLSNINEIENGTYLKSTFFSKSVMEYLLKLKLNNLHPNEFSPKIATDLYYWLQQEKLIGYDHAARTIGYLKSVLNYGILIEIISNNPIQHLRFKRSPQKKIEFLTPNELSQLKKYKFKSDRLQQIADLFILQCYTGFSYGDFQGFNPNKHIETDKRDRQWIMKPRAKNQNESILPYFPEAKIIIDKYTVFNLNKPGEVQLPQISNQKYNSYLKEIGDIMGFSINLTSHIGRKTFGTIALNNGFSIESVSRMLGHTNIRTTQLHYAVVLKKRMINEML